MDLDAILEPLLEQVATRAARKTVAALPDRVAYSVGEVARMLGTTEKSVRQMVDAGELWSVPTHLQRVFIPRAALDALVESARIDAEARISAGRSLSAVLDAAS